MHLHAGLLNQGSGNLNLGSHVCPLSHLPSVTAEMSPEPGLRGRLCWGWEQGGGIPVGHWIGKHHCGLCGWNVLDSLEFVPKCYCITGS